jgi:PRTRC genetic system protein C
MQTTLLKRVFCCTIDGEQLRLTDPNPAWSLNEVKEFYAHTHAQLLSAKVQGPTFSGDCKEYTFTTKLGNKG